MISNATKRLINLAISNLKLENPTQETINKATNYLKDAILQIRKEEGNLNENILCYLQNNTANNITKTSILKDVVGNNNAAITNLNFTKGNVIGYSGFTNRGLQLSNKNILSMNYIKTNNVEINVNTVNWNLRNKIFVLKLIDDNNNEYLLQAYHWGYISCELKNAKDTSTNMWSGAVTNNEVFTDFDDNFHSITLIFGEHKIDIYIDGEYVKTIINNNIPNITGIKLYNDDTFYSDSPYESVVFYKTLDSQIISDNYNYFINKFNNKNINYTEKTVFNTVEEMVSENIKENTIVTTKGYYSINDNGQAKYKIVSYDTFYKELPEDCKEVTISGQVKADVDNYGNHTLKNGLVAKIISDDNSYTPEQFGAKGDGVSSDTEALICLLALVKSGTINLKDGATYLIASRKDEECSQYTDNRYLKSMIGTFVGGCHRPLIANCNNLILDGNPSNDGNKATLKIPDNDFGFGMGMLNLAGHIEGLEIKNIVFNSNGLTMNQVSITGSNNKTSNHTIVYSPASKDLDNSILNDLNIHHCKFLANGTDINVSDSGGDDILIINPTASKNVWIEDNEFYDWGRWVYSVDLGGSGERLYNYKFNRNKCIQGENNRHTNPGTGLRTGKYRGLGWIDFEARKCWTGLEVKGNYVRGLAGFAMNGNGKTLIDATFSNNDIETISREYRSAYPYFINWYSVRDVKNFVCENNILNTNYSIVPSRYAVDGCTFRNNHITGGDILFLHGLYGDIIIDNNTKDNRGEILMTDDNLYLPSYLSEDEEKHCNFVFTNNNGGIKSGSGKESLLYKPSQPGEYSFINITIENNDMDSCSITTFDSPFELDPTQLTKGKDGGYVFRGAHFTGQTFTNSINNPVCCAPIYKSGELIVENVNMSRMELAYYYTSQIEKGKTYNIYCTEEGYFPLAYKDVYLLTETPNKKVSLNTFYYTKENLYVVVKEGTLGTAEEIQSINHTNGVMTCGTAELRFVTKLGKYRVEEIN